ncbi:MAG: hypothetical protein RIC55_16115 [Pirellulaceae bacterium]
MKRPTNLPNFATAALLVGAVFAGTQLAAALLPRAAWAQDPFGLGPAPATPAPGAAPSAAPAGGLSAEDDIVVRTIVNSNPDTPEKLMKATKLMLTYGRPDVAQRFLQKLITLGLDRDAWLDLERQFGSALFVEMMNTPELQPEGAQIGEAVFGAQEKASEDVPRMEKLVRELSNTSLGARTLALKELQAARYDALPPMLQALADEKRAAEHPYIRGAFLKLGLADIQPLIGALDAPDEGLRAQVIRILGLMRSREAVDYLIEPYLSPSSTPEVKQNAEFALRRILGTVPSPSDAEYYLENRTREYFNGMQPAHVDHEDAVTLWRWDADRQTVVPVRFRSADAPFVAATRTARALSTLVPENARYRRLLLASALQVDKMFHGFNRPLPHGAGTAHSIAVAAEPSDLESVLAYAMKEGLIGAAVGAAEVLGEVGTVDLLESADRFSRPLTNALRHADRRLQFTAADAIAKIDPHADFPNASRVAENLSFAAGTLGAPKALVVDPRPDVAQTLVGILSELGYEGQAAYTGKHAIKAALADPDFAMIWISDTVDYRDANELYQMLRKDPRTARTPIGLIARSENLDRWRAQLENDQLAIAFPQPSDTPDAALWTGLLLDSAGRQTIGVDERLAQASVALQHLIHFAEHPQLYDFYDLTRHQQHYRRALYTPGIDAQAARLLGLLGTPQAQRELVDRASQNATSLASRQAAAKAFAEAVSLRGTLLTTDQVLAQYDRYNQSEDLDSETQQVLGSILDTIEARAAKTKAELQP